MGNLELRLRRLSHPKLSPCAQGLHSLNLIITNSFISRSHSLRSYIKPMAFNVNILARGELMRGNMAILILPAPPASKRGY